MPNKRRSPRPPTGYTGDKSYRDVCKAREDRENFKAAYLSYRDHAYRTSGLFHETVVHEDGSTITRLRT